MTSNSKKSIKDSLLIVDDRVLVQDALYQNYCAHIARSHNWTRVEELWNFLKSMIIYSWAVTWEHRVRSRLQKERLINILHISFKVNAVLANLRIEIIAYKWNVGCLFTYSSWVLGPMEEIMDGRNLKHTYFQTHFLIKSLFWSCPRIQICNLDRLKVLNNCRVKRAESNSCIKRKDVHYLGRTELCRIAILDMFSF